ncbi:hypothetical protein NSA56_11380 [Oceanobacillus caeni]|uniref:hypothetical protein n=1 Tax=Oceanobacillus caeni TaxID=405946 RepID=UPI00214A0014|nr:hypothetical protein [Oceanobacillus caeni]MCR1834997.1 hypothetical protein [Oceanobacillus caeni]
MAEKQVILTIENVRIKEYDNMNVTVERYEEVYNQKEKKTENKWRFKGYSKGILSALLFIQRNELLIDKNTVSDLKAHLKQVKDSNNRLIESVGELE